MVWDWREALEKRMKENPEEMIHHINIPEERIENDREYKQRISERNIGIKSGVVVGVFIGLSISLLISAIEQHFGQFNFYIKLFSAAFLALIAGFLLSKMKKGELHFF
jgi:tetrahydromethanopterin S-methyltransferase subunit G